MDSKSLRSTGAMSTILKRMVRPYIITVPINKAWWFFFGLLGVRLSAVRPHFMLWWGGKFLWSTVDVK